MPEIKIMPSLPGLHSQEWNDTWIEDLLVSEKKMDSQLMRI